jgi:hypothetical protein
VIAPHRPLPCEQEFSERLHQYPTDWDPTETLQGKTQWVKRPLGFQ